MNTITVNIPADVIEDHVNNYWNIRLSEFRLNSSNCTFEWFATRQNNDVDFEYEFINTHRDLEFTVELAESPELQQLVELKDELLVSIDKLNKENAELRAENQKLKNEYSSLSKSFWHKIFKSVDDKCV